MGRAKTTNPKPETWSGGRRARTGLLSLGCDGKHTWTLQNTTNGRRMIAFKPAITRVEE